MQKEYIFKARAVNKEGVKGVGYIEGGMVVPLDGVTKKERLGTNPEELLGLSWSACLNSTILSLLKRDGLTNESEVRVDVYLKRNREAKKLYFQVDGFADIKGMTVEEMQPYIDEAHERCPVSQLISKSETVTLKPYKFE